MVTPELTPPPGATRHTATVALAATTALWAITALGALSVGIDPGLASAQPPHPVLDPDLGAWLAILVNNARVLCLPVGFALLGLRRHRLTRRIGDTTVVVELVLNGLWVGVELGRWQARLIPYIPQLPVEWLAAGTAAAVWFTSSGHPPTRRQTTGCAVTVIALLCAAAAIEVLLTPHAPRRRG